MGQLSCLIAFQKFWTGGTVWEEWTLGAFGFARLTNRATMMNEQMRPERPIFLRDDFH
jgi:hypothetical protein